MRASSPASPDATSTEVFERRRTSFGAIAETYHRARPGWPPVIMEWLLGESSQAQQAMDVLDVGCGTGLGALTAHHLGHRVTAIDSDPLMVKYLQAAGPDIAVHCAPAEAIPQADQSIDVVLALQCWHWFSEDRAAAECARVLRPGGTLALAWHVDGSGLQWQRVMAEVKGAAPPAQMEPGRAELGGRFRLDAQRDHHYTETLTVDLLLERVSTWSYVTAREDAAAIMADLRAAAERDAAADGILTVPGRAWMYRYVADEGLAGS